MTAPAYLFRRMHCREGRYIAHSQPPNRGAPQLEAAIVSSADNPASSPVRRYTPSGGPERRSSTSWSRNHSSFGVPSFRKGFAQRRKPLVVLVDDENLGLRHGSNLSADALIGQLAAHRGDLLRHVDF